MFNFKKKKKVINDEIIIADARKDFLKEKNEVSVDMQKTLAEIDEILNSDDHEENDEIIIAEQRKDFLKEKNEVSVDMQKTLTEIDEILNSADHEENIE